MVTVRLSKRKDLLLPESLGQTLGLRQGDRVEIRRQDNVLWVRRQETIDPPGPLTDLAYIVSSSLPPNSVDVQQAMNWHGYEQVHGRIGL